MLPVSAIIPTYNRARSIERAVRSALAATAPGDEIVVVDDGSRDETEQVLKPYRHWIRYVRTENRGAGAARNRGVAEARNPLIAFLDSDDEWLPWRIELARRFLEARPDVLFCFSNIRSDHGNRVVHDALRFWTPPGTRAWEELLASGAPYSATAKLPSGWDDFLCHTSNVYSAELACGVVCTITLTVRREEAGAALHFPEDVPTYEDWWCFSQLARRGLGTFLDCETAIQHCHREPRLTDANSLECASTRLRMMEQIWGRDAEFLEKNQALYQRVHREQRLRRIKGLLKNGLVGQARNELREMRDAPAACRVLARLPGAFLARFFGIRQRLDFARRRFAQGPA
jgi:hypothetical protein